MKTPKLIADFDGGEGSVKIPPEFAALDALLRADLLMDWLHFLEQHYNAAVMEFRNEMVLAGAKPDIPSVGTKVPKPGTEH